MASLKSNVWKRLPVSAFICIDFTFNGFFEVERMETYNVIVRYVVLLCTFNGFFEVERMETLSTEICTHLKR